MKCIVNSNINRAAGALCLCFAAVSYPCLALSPMPQESGLSGFINLGANSGRIESNFLARIAGFDIDLGHDTISSLNSPSDKGFVAPNIKLNAAYTFSNLKTQLSLGNDLSEFLQFDSSTMLSARHDFDVVGRLQLSFLSSSSLSQIEVWSDPYQLDEKRDATERTSDGFRITWDKIFGTQFELKLQTRESDLDDERSGEGLGLNEADRQLLDREGDVGRVELGYLLSFDDGENLIRPVIAYVDRDFDGKAMAQDGYEVGVSWAYNNRNNLRTVVNIKYERLEADKTNPIFDDKWDSDTIYVATRAFFPGLFGLKNWEPNVAAVWSESDSDIDFNDMAGWMVSASIGRKF
jgi:hypothetical protein